MDIDTFISIFVPTHEFEPFFVQKHPTQNRALINLYSKIKCKFPPLFEQLLLTYSWSNASTSQFQLHDNPPGEDLSGFFAAISSDKILFDGCIQNKLLIFGKSSNSYNPICFHCIGKSPRNYSIVEVDHESILTPGKKLKIMPTLSKDFTQLMQQHLA